MQSPAPSPASPLGSILKPHRAPACAPPAGCPPPRRSVLSLLPPARRVPSPLPRQGALPPPPEGCPPPSPGSLRLPAWPAPQPSLPTCVLTCPCRHPHPRSYHRYCHLNLDLWSHLRPGSIHLHSGHSRLAHADISRRRLACIFTDALTHTLRELPFHLPPHPLSHLVSPAAQGSTPVAPSPAFGVGQWCPGGGGRGQAGRHFHGSSG